MSTAQTLIYSGTGAAANRKPRESAEENPRTRRVCILPAVRGLEVHPRESGLQRAEIPFGVPLTFETFPDMRVRNWSVDPDDRSPADTLADLTAKAGVDAVSRAAHQGSRDMGFRELRALTPLADAEAARLLAAVLPPLDPEDCPYGEENTDELSIEAIVEKKGESVARVQTVEVFRCLACTLAWLRSPECGERAAALKGGKELRAQALDAYQTNYGFFATLWAEYDADMKKRERNEPGISRLDDGHLHVMRQLHQIAPEMRAAETIRQSNEASADAMKEGFREVAREMASAMTPKIDMDEVVRLATERAKKELRDEMEAGKPGKDGK